MAFSSNTLQFIGAFTFYNYHFFKYQCVPQLGICGEGYQF